MLLIVCDLVNVAKESIPNCSKKELTVVLVVELLFTNPPQSSTPVVAGHHSSMPFPVLLTKL